MISFALGHGGARRGEGFGGWESDWADGRLQLRRTQQIREFVSCLHFLGEPQLVAPQRVPLSSGGRVNSERCLCGPVLWAERGAGRTAARQRSRGRTGRLRQDG